MHLYIYILYIYTNTYTCIYIYVCVYILTRSCVWHDSGIHATNAFSCVMGLRGGFICVTWLIHICDMTRLDHVCDSRVLQVIRGIMTRLCTWHVSGACVAWRIHMCDVTSLYMWRDVCVCVTARYFCYRAAKKNRMKIIFHKRATKYRSLLRRMTYKDKGSYESSPLCKWVMTIYVHTYIHMCVL